MSKVNDVSVPGVGRYIATKHYRIRVEIYDLGKPVTYTVLFACIPCLEGIAAMLKDAGNRLLEIGDNLADVNLAETTLAMRWRGQVHLRLADLVLTQEGWPNSIAKLESGILMLRDGENRGSVSVTPEYSWSLHNA